MFKLAHISDVHLAPLPQPSFGQLCSKRITGYLNWQKNRAKKLDPRVLSGLIAHLKKQQVDHIAVTGDMINLAFPDEFPQALQWLHKLGDPQNVSLVLGNHDTYVPGAYDQACRQWAEFMGGDGHSGPAQFPYLRVRNKISIIGTNSGIPTLPFTATGYFDGPQAQKLEKILVEEGERGQFRVVMIHHPPVAGAALYFKRLINMERFQAVVAKAGAELILHGHTHVDSQNRIQGNNGEVPVIGVPAAGQTPGGHRPPSRYNLFSIEREGNQWQCQMQEFGYKNSVEDRVQFIHERAIEVPGSQVQTPTLKR